MPIADPRCPASRPRPRASVFIAISVAAVAAALAGCHGHHAPPQSTPRAPQPVHVVTAVETTTPVLDDLIGTVRPRRVADVSPSIMATVGALHVAVGSVVEEHQVLVQLSAREIAAQAQHASAMFERADVARRRAERLHADAVIAPAAYEEATTQVRAAAATLAEANVRQSYTTVRAPFAGVVTAKLCDVGDLAVPGRPLLTIESLETMRLEVAVPERLSARVRLGDTYSAVIDALPAPLDATVSELAPSADASSRTVLIKLDLPRVEGLRTGLFGRLSVHAGDRRVVLVDQRAVVQRGQMELVFVFERDHAALRIVRTGKRRGEDVEITAGLVGGERVVVSPGTLEDGQPVEVVR